MRHRQWQAMEEYAVRHRQWQVMEEYAQTQTVAGEELTSCSLLHAIPTGP